MNNIEYHEVQANEKEEELKRSRQSRWVSKRKECSDLISEYL